MNKTGSRKTESPSGWVIKTYRHMNIPKSDFRGTKELFDEIHRRRKEDTNASAREKHPNRDITYGNYDRIQMVPVNSFSDFTNESSKTYNWYGSSQSILIFPLENGKSRRRFHWGVNSNGREGIVIKDKDGKEIKAGNTFFGASFCYISDEARSMIRSYEELIASLQ